MLAGETAVALFEEQRAYLFSIAYRLMGTVSDAEDILQSAYLRWQSAAEPQVRSVRAYLATIVVRLCLDELRSARARREVYVGPWLPEPLVTSDRADLTESLILRESLSFAFLLLLEKLTALERAVFVLREVFDYDYAEIALMVDRSPANCRQVFHRARRRIREDEVRFDPSPEQLEVLTQQFMAAVQSGDVQSVARLLADDVTHTPDTGGRIPVAARQPIHTPDRVARGMLGAVSKAPPDAVWIEQVNGQPAIVSMRHGHLQAVLLLESRDGRVRRIYTVANPDKLRSLVRSIERTGADAGSRGPRPGAASA